MASGLRRPALIEVKTEIHDFGRIQWTLGWYEHRAFQAARRLGWTPRHSHAALFLLDTEAVAAVLRTNRELANQAFPERAAVLGSFLEDPAVAVPRGRAMATIDPLSRRRSWLGATPLDKRRRPPAYVDYADVARRILR